MPVLELHGSVLEIWSDRGAGSRFAFRLLEAEAGGSRAIPEVTPRPEANGELIGGGR